MTKKHYKLFANEIHKFRYNTGLPGEIFNSWVDLTSDIFEKDNPNFNRDEYAKACYEGKHIK